MQSESDNDYKNGLISRAGWVIRSIEGGCGKNNIDEVVDYVKVITSCDDLEMLQEAVAIAYKRELDIEITFDTPE